MMASGVRRRVAVRAFVAGVLGLLLATGADATPPARGGHQIGGHVVGVRPLPPLNGPAGPTPLNPAGPTPLNPAGPPPLGAPAAFPRHVVPFQRPGMHVGIVGNGYGYGPGGSFYCQVHDRGYASQTLFLNHLADADGVYGEDAMSLLFEDGGVVVFPAE